MLDKMCEHIEYQTLLYIVVCMLYVLHCTMYMPRYTTLYKYVQCEHEARYAIVAMQRG